MKPYDEDWRLGDGTIFVSDPEAPAFLFLAGSDNDARARLAAQAPAMARLLLDMVSEDNDGRLPSMTRLAPDHYDAAMAVLRAAGVIE